MSETCADCTSGAGDQFAVYLCARHRAVPELLAALDSIVHAHHTPETWMTAMRTAEAAIRKAQGSASPNEVRPA